jgi:hypothetical protein
MHTMGKEEASGFLYWVDSHPLWQRVLADTATVLAPHLLTSTKDAVKVSSDRESSLSTLPSPPASPHKNGVPPHGPLTPARLPPRSTLDNQSSAVLHPPSELADPLTRARSAEDDWSIRTSGSAENSPERYKSEIADRMATFLSLPEAFLMTQDLPVPPPDAQRRQTMGGAPLAPVAQRSSANNSPNKNPMNNNHSAGGKPPLYPSFPPINPFTIQAWDSINTPYDAALAAHTAAAAQRASTKHANVNVNDHNFSSSYNSDASSGVAGIISPCATRPASYGACYEAGDGYEAPPLSPRSLLSLLHANPELLMELQSDPDMMGHLITLGGMVPHVTPPPPPPPPRRCVCVLVCVCVDVLVFESERCEHVRERVCKSDVCVCVVVGGCLGVLESDKERLSMFVTFAHLCVSVCVWDYGVIDGAYFTMVLPPPCRQQRNSPTGFESYNSMMAARVPSTPSSPGRCEY